MEIASIVLVSSIELSLIITTFKDYEIISYYNGKLTLQKNKSKDAHKRRIAFDTIISDVMINEREKGLELYRLFPNNEAFRIGMSDNLERALMRTAI